MRAGKKEKQKNRDVFCDHFDHSSSLITILYHSHTEKNRKNLAAGLLACCGFFFFQDSPPATFRPFTTNVLPNHPILGWSRLSGRGLTRAVSNCVSNFPAKVTIPVSDHHHFVLLSFVSVNLLDHEDESLMFECI